MISGTKRPASGASRYPQQYDEEESYVESELDESPLMHNMDPREKELVGQYVDVIDGRWAKC